MIKQSASVSSSVVKCHSNSLIKAKQILVMLHLNFHLCLIFFYFSYIPNMLLACPFIFFRYKDLKQNHVLGIHDRVRY